MRVKMQLSIGFPTAKHEDVIDVDDAELEGLSEEQKENYLFEYANEWAQNYIELGVQVVEDDQ